MKYTLKVGYLQTILVVSCIILGALLAYNTLVAYPSFNSMLTENTEEEAVRVARYLMSEVIRTGWQGRLDEEDIGKIQDAREHFKLWKLKIFSDTGEVVYSTDADEIGTVNDSDNFRNIVARGNVLSHVVIKDSKTSEGQKVPINITETYVPIIKNGSFQGAFEIYYDITDRKAKQDANLQKFSLVSVSISTLFFIAMIFMLERTGKSIVQRRLAEQKIRTYQRQLVEAEKMASLGGLVAGVAHEINTPIGAAVTVASTLNERSQACDRSMQDNDLRRSDLVRYLDLAKDSSAVILSSLRQAAELIRSFKQVAVDQSSEEKRTFRIRQCIDDVLTSLRPKFRGKECEVAVNCSRELEITGYPGAMSQIFTNLLINALDHGFEGAAGGTIRIDVSTDSRHILILFADDGTGMNEETVKKIFEPFYTTKRGRGGSGLGMHIVYNIISQRFGGTIECRSKPGEGTTFTIRLPMEKVNNEAA